MRRIAAAHGAALRPDSLIAVSDAEPDMAAALRRALTEAGYRAARGVGDGLQADAVILTEGLTDAAASERHWAVLSAMRTARAVAPRLIGLQRDRGATGIEGLTRTLRKEWPEVEAVSWTLPADATASAAAKLVAAAAAAGAMEGLLCADGSVQRPVAEQPVGPKPIGDVPGDRVWLVTGGARGVTAACAIALAGAAGGTFLLAGRSPPSDWPADIEETDDLKTLRSLMITAARAQGQTPKLADVDKQARAALAGRDIRRTLDAIRRAGARAEYLIMDAGDAATVAGAIRQATARHGPITGLVHGAGVLADRLAADKTEAELGRVFAPKVEGLLNILAAIDPAKLTHAALFSSAAAFFGNKGQADYAMANAVLARLGQDLARSHPALRVKVFHWGPWAGGMVDEALAGHFAAQGIPLIPVADGADIFVSELLGGAASDIELVVGEAWAET